MPRFKGKKKVPAKTAKDKQQDRQIKRIVADYRPELKHYWTVSNNTGTGLIQSDNSPQVHLLCTPTQGTEQVNRVGDRIKLKHVRLSFVLHASANSPLANQMMRVILFYHKGYNGVSVPYTEILGPPYSINNGSMTNFHVGYNRDYVNIGKDKSKAITILYDKSYVVGPLNSTYGTTENNHFHRIINKSLGGRTTVFDGTFNRNGQLMMLFIAGCGTTSTENPRYQWISDVSFTDA